MRAKFGLRHAVAAAAVSGLGIVSAVPASAQSRVYGVLEGGYLWSFGSASDGIESSLIGANPISLKPGSGWGGRVAGGFHFERGWDGGIAVGGSFLSKGEDSRAALCCGGTGFVTANGRQDAWFLTTDLEAGYWMSGGRLTSRLFVGLRALWSDHSLSGSYLAGFAPDLTDSGVYASETRYFGVGPRMGGQFWLPIGGSGFGVTAQLAGTFLYGSLSQKGSLTRTIQVNVDPPVVTTTSLNDSTWKGAAMFDADLGFYYQGDAGMPVGVTLGWRFQGIWGTADKQADANAKGDGHRFVHGPYARLTFNFGPGARNGGLTETGYEVDEEDGDGAPVAAAPRTQPPPAPTPAGAPRAPAGPPGPVAGQIPFQGDSFVIGPAGFEQIRAAVAQARSGQRPRLSVSGARLNGGHDPALALARANAVRSTLALNGLRAETVAIATPGTDVSGARAVIYLN